MLFTSFTPALLVAYASLVASKALPVVDLIYERHQAISFNQTVGYYNFSNVRYAQPPVGNLRWQPPLAPTGRSSKINDGSVGAICPQANPTWDLIAAVFIPDYLSGKPFDYNAVNASIEAMNMTFTEDPRTSEDCLFLDVYVPEKIFANRQENKDDCDCDDEEKRKKLSPVMVYIYGGGYTGGEKTGFGAYNPSGLFNASQNGVVIVNINYRLGVFGWLGGPSLQSQGTAQPGLYDQRLALEWVQKNIHKFGGNPHDVTVFGESAGGGSIFHQITAYGGLNGRAPFKKAIMQSPAWANIPSAHQQEAAYTKFLEILNVKTLDEARNLPSLQLRMANAIQVAMSAYGQFTFGPLVDGVFTPALPQRLLLQGSYDKSVKIMVGHNGDEGLLFANPLTDSTDKLDALLLNAFPGIQPDVVDYITNTLYPAVFDGSKNYTTQFQRQRNILADSSFVCNWWYLNQAFKDQSYAYIFNVFPAIHGQDIGFTWDDGYSAPSFASVMTAQIFQQFLTSYALTGKPEIRDLPNMKFTPYGTSGQHITQFTAQAVTDVVDPTDSMACAWWQKSLYY